MGHDIARAGVRAGAALLAAFLLEGCPITIGVSDQVQADLEGARDAINSNSSQWQQVVGNLGNQMNTIQSQVDETIRNDVQNLVNRSIANSGVEFRCDADFLGARVKSELQGILDRYLALKRNGCFETANGRTTLKTGANCDIPRVQLPPSLCSEVPGLVDLNLKDGRAWSAVTLNGYDLDHKDPGGNPFQVGLVGETNDWTPFPEARVVRNTHYQATLNLSGFGPTLYAQKTAKIKLRWNGTDLAEIGVAQWLPRTEDVTIYPASTEYQPPRVHGDDDFDAKPGAPTDVNLKARYVQKGNSIFGQVYMHAREEHPDNTEVDGWSTPQLIYTAPPGKEIASFSPSAEASVDYSVSDKLHLPTSHTTSAGQVANFTAWVDRDGGEAGSWTHVRAEWRNLSLKIREAQPTW